MQENVDDYFLFMLYLPLEIFKHKYIAAYLLIVSSLDTLGIQLLHYVERI